METRVHSNSENIKARHAKRQNMRRREMKRRRIIFFSILFIIFVLIIMFLTPLFNIKKIDITGNERIETALIKQSIGSVEEENLFKLSGKKLENNIKTIPYVDDVSIKKVIIPTSLKVNVIECVPVGFIFYNEQFIIVDKKIKILEIVDTKPENMAEITGLTITAANVGAVIETDDVEKLNVVIDCISKMVDQDIVSKTYSMNFNDINNIIFNYENRLDVVCGSSLDFSKKIGMFYMALNSDKLTANSRGTIDISIAGKAIYTP